MEPTTAAPADYYTRGLAVSDALEHDETLRIGLGDGWVGDLEGRELYDAWNDLAPGETFDVLGRVDEAGELRPIDWESLQGAPSGYRPGAVTMDVVDDAPSIPAYVNAWYRWNGFAVPIFTREALIASRAALETIFDRSIFGDDAEGLQVTFDADGFPSIIDLAEPEAGDFVVAIERDGKTFYDIGGGGFVWQDVPREHPHTYRADIADHWCTYCGTVTDNCTKINPR